MHATAVTHRCWLWRLELVLEALGEAVASEVGIPVLSYMLIRRSCMEYGTGVWRPSNGNCSYVIILPTKTKRVSLLFRNCFMFISVTVSNIHQFLITQIMYSNPVFQLQWFTWYCRSRFVWFNCGEQ
jgi:hypothetical protein